MTDAEKLARLKVLLNDNTTDFDTQYGVYLAMASDEILNWLYSVAERPEDVTTVPRRYEQVQIQAVVAGVNIQGAENQTSHSENGISRQFRHADMLAYIHANVFPYAGVVE